MAPTIAWVDGAVELIDQTRLPQDTVVLRLETVEALVAAIQRLSVRGAPALGVAGAYGVALAASQYLRSGDLDGHRKAVAALRAARPTAVNLARMVDRVASAAGIGAGQGSTTDERSTAGVGADIALAAALAEAHLVRDEEVQASVAMGERGADLLLALTGRSELRVMTICNTGGLAAVERGTALAVVQTLHERGALVEAIPMETRPLLQGGRLTTWELARMGAPHRLIVDSAAPFLLARGAADAVVIGADRVVANGDTANKIGSYALALGARRAGVPFVVVAPESTIDGDLATGNDIEIEDRGPDEVASVRGVAVAPAGTDALNPAFDVTPADLITALVTDRRVVSYDGPVSLRPLV